MSQLSSSRARPVGVATNVQAALAALQAGRLAEAERLSHAVLKSNWGHVLAAQILGQAILLQNRPEEAVEPMRRAARRSHDPMTETLLAKALMATDRADAAFDQLRLATTRRPAYAPAFLELGDGLRRAGRLDDAAATFEAGARLMPEAHVLRVGLGHVWLSRGDPARARAAFEAVLAAAPGRRDAILGLAQAVAVDGEPAAAAELYRQALAAQPQDAPARLGLARCLLEAGDRTGGEAALRAVARSGPEMAGQALIALAGAAHGRFFLRPSAAARFLRVPSP
jgi:predicted Zn-dependent protease